MLFKQFERLVRKKLNILICFSKVKEESEQKSKDDSDQIPEKGEECNESDSKETGIQKECGTKENEEKGEEQKEEVILLDGQKEKTSEEESGVRQRKVLSEQNED